MSNSTKPKQMWRSHLSPRSYYEHRLPKHKRAALPNPSELRYTLGEEKTLRIHHLHKQALLPCQRLSMGALLGPLPSTRHSPISVKVLRPRRLQLSNVRTRLANHPQYLPNPTMDTARVLSDPCSSRSMAMCHHPSRVYPMGMLLQWCSNQLSCTISKIVAQAQVSETKSILLAGSIINTMTGVKDALITNLCIRTPLDSSPERRFVFNVPPHPKLLQPSYTISLGPSQWKLQIIPRMSPALEEQQRAYKMFVLVNGQLLGRGIPNPRDPIQHGESLHDAQLHAGTNTIVVQMIAALPKGQTLPNGSDAVLEKITIFANVTRQY